MSELKDAIDKLDIAEAYGLAMKIEKDGYTLYQRAIEITDNNRAKEDLIFLRDQENGHKAFFEKLLKETGREYTENKDSALYLWAEENLIGPVRTILENKAPENYQEALSLGLKLEDKSIQFYKELKKASETKETRKAIKKIISEEKRHIKFLNAVLNYSIP